jgi:hypothetical protein
MIPKEKSFADIFKALYELVNEPMKPPLDGLVIEKNRNIIKERWEYRVHEFLYFCLDGGVTNGLFNIQVLFQIMSEVQKNSYLPELNGILVTLINIKKDPPIFGEKLKTAFSGDKSKIKSLFFNESLLCKIIQDYDVKLVFEFENEVQEQDFYSFLLEKNYSYKFLSNHF